MGKDQLQKKCLSMLCKNIKYNNTHSCGRRRERRQRQATNPSTERQYCSVTSQNGCGQQWRNCVQKGKNVLIVIETRLMYLKTKALIFVLRN